MTQLDRRVDAVLFDLDDTLVNSRAAFAAGIRAAAGVFLPDLPTERYGEVLALWRLDPLGYYRRYTAGELDFEAQRMLRVNQLQASFGGAQLAEAQYQDWVQVFWGTCDQSWTLFDDVIDTLDNLRAAGVQMGIVTNASEDIQQRKLMATGLMDLFPVMVTVDTLGVGKPHPRLWQVACEQLEVPTQRAVYVGDELDTDALGAQVAGLHGVWLDRPGARRGGERLEDPEHARACGVSVLSGLDQLLPLIGHQVRSAAPTEQSA